MILKKEIFMQYIGDFQNYRIENQVNIKNETFKWVGFGNNVTLGFRESKLILLLINNSILHYKSDLTHFGNILNGISCYSNKVCQETFLNHS